MKIALCISGQPRNLDQCFPHFKKAFLDNKNIQVDVFAHIWWDEEYEGKTYMWHSTAKFEKEDLGKKFLQMFQPKSYKIEKQRQFDLSFCKQHNMSWLDPSLPQKQLDIFTPGALFCVMSQSYSIWQSDILRQSSEEEYDLVVRARTDTVFSGEVDYAQVLSHIKQNPNDVLWQNSMHGGPQYGGEFPNSPCDWFCVALPETMARLTYQWHNSVPEHYKDGVIHIKEHVHKMTEKANANLSSAQFYAHMYRKNDGNPHEFREVTNYWEDFDSSTGKIKSRKEDWPFWAEKIDFARLAKGEE